MISSFLSRVPKPVVFSSSLAVVATLLFVINDATIKYLSLKNIKFYHFIFYGTPAYLVAPLYLIFSGKFKNKMRAINYWIPLSRGLIFVPMPFLSFWALKYVSLAEFTTLTMSAPIFSLIFSILILKERPNLFLFLSLFFGVFGVLMVMKPGFDNFNIFFLVVLLNALLISLTTLLVNKFSNLTSPEGYFVYGGIFVHMFAVILFIFDPKMFEFKTIILMTFASIVVNIAVFLLVLAFQKAQNFYGSISCLNYLQIFWSVIISVMVFGQVLDYISILGALLIVCSGLLSLPAQSKQISQSK
jgi:drug/metabolite transporter (DMT)-like permease